MTVQFDPISAKLRVSFQYRKDLVDAIKAMPVRSYNPETKAWLIGFDHTNLDQIFALLQRFKQPADDLETAKTAAATYLQAQTATPAAQDLNAHLVPLLQTLGDLVLEAHLAGRIDQQTQGDLIELINHLSLRDFIKS